MTATAERLPTGAERAFVMMAMRSGGMTCEAIGAEFGLTRERVRQILAKHGGDPMGGRVGTSRPIQEVIAAADASRSAEEFSRRIGFAHVNRGRNLLRYLELWPVYQSRWEAARVYDRVMDMLHHLRGLSRRLGGRTPGQRDLSAVPGPSHVTYFNWFGSLRTAQWLAGLIPNEPRPPEYAVERSRRALRERPHCRRGHLYTPDNLHVDKRGHRHCRACGRLRDKASRQRRKAVAA